MIAAGASRAQRAIHAAILLWWRWQSRCGVRASLLATSALLLAELGAFDGDGAAVPGGAGQASDRGMARDGGSKLGLQLDGASPRPLSARGFAFFFSPSPRLFSTRREVAPPLKVSAENLRGRFHRVRDIFPNSCSDFGAMADAIGAMSPVACRTRTGSWGQSSATPMRGGASQGERLIKSVLKLSALRIKRASSHNCSIAQSSLARPPLRRYPFLSGVELGPCEPAYASHRYSICTSMTNRCAKHPCMKAAPGSGGSAPRRSGAEYPL